MLFILVIVLSVFICAIVAAIAYAAIKGSDPKNGGDYALHFKMPKVTWNESSTPIPVMPGSPEEEAMLNQAREEAIRSGKQYTNISVESKIVNGQIKTVVKNQEFINMRMKCHLCDAEINVDKDTVCPSCGTPVNPDDVRAAREARIQEAINKSRETLEKKLNQ